MAYADSLSTTFTGRVVSVNDKGLKLEGHETWMNVSKFAPAFALPARGDTVTVAVDSKGFLRSCQVIPSSAVADLPRTSPRASDRERVITRLAVLKAAAEFGAARPDLKSAEVLRIADSWVAWVEASADRLAEAV